MSLANIDALLSHLSLLLSSISSSFSRCINVKWRETERSYKGRLGELHLQRPAEPLRPAVANGQCFSERREAVDRCVRWNSNSRPHDECLMMLDARGSEPIERSGGRNREDRAAQQAEQRTAAHKMGQTDTERCSHRAARRCRRAAHNPSTGGRAAPSSSSSSLTSSSSSSSSSSSPPPPPAASLGCLPPAAPGSFSPSVLAASAAGSSPASCPSSSSSSSSSSSASSSSVRSPPSPSSSEVSSSYRATGRPVRSPVAAPKGSCSGVSAMLLEQSYPSRTDRSAIKGKSPVDGRLRSGTRPVAAPSPSSEPSENPPAQHVTQQNLENVSHHTRLSSLLSCHTPLSSMS